MIYDGLLALGLAIVWGWGLGELFLWLLWPRPPTDTE